MNYNSQALKLNNISTQIKFRKPPKDFSSFGKTYEYMKSILNTLMPEDEIAIKAELVYAINELKHQKDAVILGHNYMEPALYHTVADICGDSLMLAKKGASSKNSTIVVCGVRFMAETAKILSYDKKVLLPSLKAGCSLAASITAEDVRSLKKLYPGVPVVSYVNTYADIKAESDICCTSSNADKVVEYLDSAIVIFIPDRYLAANVAKKTGRSLLVAKRSPSNGLQTELISKDQDFNKTKASMLTWNGTCEVHERFTVEDIHSVRAQFKQDVVILAHPECKKEVCDAADFSGSTAAMIDYVKHSKSKKYLLLTECAMADNIISQNQHKDLLRMCSYRCPHMATITLDMTLKALKKDQYEITLDPQIQSKAYQALAKMIEIS